MEAILPPVASSLAKARGMVSRIQNAPREALENAKLVLTELLANEIKHGRYRDGEELFCRVTRQPRALRIEVRHPGPAFAMPSGPVEPVLQLRETGWGLALITRLADRWGMDEKSGGRNVWAEIDLGPKAVARSA
jgi:anti-sigma regulatory factor (Ser/Thr protein kinase)